VVTVAFMPNAIRSYFGDGSELGVRMVYATEETPLGTAGSVRNARDELTSGSWSFPATSSPTSTSRR
jgi:mannose-1-phosphate guanylyltransferase/phosphomannomutase